MHRSFLFLAATLGFICCAGQAAATPNGCDRGVVDASSPLIGSWTHRQRDDDTGRWDGTWTVDFQRDGSWTSSGGGGGRWCVVDGNVLLFGFDDPPHTTYRATVSADVIRGTESWDGGGTGEFELRRR